MTYSVLKVICAANPELMPTQEVPSGRIRGANQ